MVEGVSTNCLCLSFCPSFSLSITLRCSFRSTTTRATHYSHSKKISSVFIKVHPGFKLESSKLSRHSRRLASMLLSHRPITLILKIVRCEAPVSSIDAYIAAAVVPMIVKYTLTFRRRSCNCERLAAACSYRPSLDCRIRPTESLVRSLV